MKIIRVQYQVREDYIRMNKANVRAVMRDLQNDPIEGMHYSCFYLGDGRFMHLNSSEDEEASRELSSRETFMAFQMGLKASDPILSPQAEEMEFVGSNIA